MALKITQNCMEYKEKKTIIPQKESGECNGIFGGMAYNPISVK